jgi:hypothetical protein
VPAFPSSGHLPTCCMAYYTFYVLTFIFFNISH